MSEQLPGGGMENYPVVSGGGSTAAEADWSALEANASDVMNTRGEVARTATTPHDCDRFLMPPSL